MDKISCSFTVFFEDPFWVGVFERRKAYQGEDLLTACKITFGAQPTDPQVYEYLLEHYRDLKFSPPVLAKQQNLAKNPKRIQREIQRSVRSNGTGTKSQQALSKMREENNLEAVQRRRERRRLEKEGRGSSAPSKKRV